MVDADETDGYEDEFEDDVIPTPNIMVAKEDGADKVLSETVILEQSKNDSTVIVDQDYADDEFDVL